MKHLICISLFVFSVLQSQPSIEWSQKFRSNLHQNTDYVSINTENNQREEWVNTFYEYQRWETDHWGNDDRTNKYYDSNGNINIEIKQHWDDNIGWELTWKYVYSYDENNNQTSRYSYYWRENQSLYENQNRRIYTYDDNNNMVHRLFQNWNVEQSVWVNTYNTVYTYDDNNNQIQWLSQDWDGAQWVNGSNSSSTYDENNNLVEYISQNWDGTQWVNNYQYFDTYNSSNNILTSTRYSWDIDQSIWKESWYSTWTYDANNNVLSVTGQQWDIDQSVWVNNSNTVYTYDENNNLVEYISQNWDGTQYNSTYRYNYIYDINNNRINGIRQGFVDDIWVNSRLYTYDYSQIGIKINNIDDVTIIKNGTINISLSATNPFYQADINYLAYSDTSSISLDIGLDTVMQIIPQIDWTGYSLITITAEYENTFYDSLTFSVFVVPMEPVISEITDVPNDQGGWVYVSFIKSAHDQYTMNDRNELYSVERYDNNEWVNVVSGVAYGQYEYVFLCPTITDSNSTDDGMTSFRVIASMDEGIYLSMPFDGYSLDNIAPSVPTGFMIAMGDNGLDLTWNAVQDDDFQYYVIDKSADSLFMTDQYGSFSTINTFYNDADYEYGTVYYRVSAIDYAGNRGDFSGTVSTSILALDSDVIPQVFTLHQNYPNPFNPVTSLRYDLPEDGIVNITIYDMMGRIVKTLVNSSQTAGFKSVQWNATNDRNEPVSAGLYLYTIQAGEFRQTKKMVLLK